VILGLRGGIGRGRVGGFAEGLENHGGDCSWRSLRFGPRKGRQWV